jgi:hypothetical protein
VRSQKPNWHGSGVSTNASTKKYSCEINWAKTKEVATRIQPIKNEIGPEYDLLPP